MLNECTANNANVRCFQLKVRDRYRLGIKEARLEYYSTITHNYLIRLNGGAQLPHPAMAEPIMDAIGSTNIHYTMGPLIARIINLL